MMMTGNYELSNACPVREPTTAKKEALTGRYHLPNRQGLERGAVMVQ
jgi:hypothetical protein